MNIYCVVSETLYEYDIHESMGDGPPEPYCIAELVAAKSRSQARYIAWETDPKTFESDIREMPRMSVHLCKKDGKRITVLNKGIVTNDPRFQDCWGCAK